ncbi:MAG: LCP family protein [Firmicutes bacterium]|nr:LCP family protein [Bacillota bacterium]
MTRKKRSRKSQQKRRPARRSSEEIKVELIDLGSREGDAGEPADTGDETRIQKIHPVDELKKAEEKPQEQAGDTDNTAPSASAAAQSSSESAGRQAEAAPEDAKSVEEAVDAAQGNGSLSGDELPGTELPGGKKSEKKLSGKKITVRILLIVLLVLVILAALLYGVYHFEFSRLQKEDKGAYSDKNVEALVAGDAKDKEIQEVNDSVKKQLAGLGEADSKAAEGDVFKDDSVYNILLIGTDDRTDNFSENARGDSCILLSLNKDNGKVYLTSFERSIGVPVLWGAYEGQWDWLTHTFRYGGAEMQTAEVRENFKIDVDRYVRVNLHTLIETIDAIGGVDVALTKPEAEHLNHPEGTYTAGYITGMHVEKQMQVVHPGMNHLNGATAMVYARTRAIDDDWHRVKRQRRIIMAAAHKLSSLSAVDMISTLNKLVPYIQTNLTEGEVANLLTLAPKFMGASVTQMTLPQKGTYGAMRGMEGRTLTAVDFDLNSKIFRKTVYGIDYDEADTASTEADTIESGGYAKPYDAATGKRTGSGTAGSVNGAAQSSVITAPGATAPVSPSASTGGQVITTPEGAAAGALQQTITAPANPQDAAAAQTPSISAPSQDPTAGQNAPAAGQNAQTDGTAGPGEDTALKAAAQAAAEAAAAQAFAQGADQNTAQAAAQAAAEQTVQNAGGSQ